MMAAGRLQIDEVVGILAKETGTEAARWEATLVTEIKSGALPLKNPRDLRDFLPYAVPKNLRTFYDRVDVADVDKLLNAHPEWRVEYRFNSAELPSGNTPAASIRTVKRVGDKWSDAELKTLLAESKLPGATQEKLAKQYNVSRPRIGTLLNQAKDKFETRAKASWHPSAGVGSRKLKGDKY